MKERIEKTVKAKKVRAGDFIPALGNGYCPEDADPTVRCSLDGISVTGIGSVLITMHDEQGDEFYLYCWKNMPVTVSREVKS